MQPINLKKSLISIALLTGLAATTQATATTFQFDIAYPDGSANAGDVTNFSTSYNDVTQQLTWSSTIHETAGNLADGFWMVLSDGENPKNDFNEYAIFYGDTNTGNLTSYVYNGLNSGSSWNNPGEFIESFASALSTDTSVADEVTLSFSIDVSNINGYTPTTTGTNDWDGASFADQVGIWYHPLVFGGAGPTYNADGSLLSFPVKTNGWYDTSYQDTTVVPVPAAAWLFASGLIGLIGVSRRRA